MSAQNRTKEIWVISVVSLFTVCMLFLVRAVAEQLAGSTGLGGTIVGMLLFVWAALLANGYLVLYEWRTGRYIITGVAVIASFVVGLFSLTSIIGGLLVGLFFSGAAYNIALAAKERITFRLRHNLLVGIKYIVAGIAVFFVIMLLPTVQQYATNGGVAIPTDAVDITLRPATPIIANMLPGYTPDATIDQLIDAQVEKQLEGLPAGIPAQAPSHSIILADLTRSFGVEIRGSDTLASVVARYVNQYIQELAGGSGAVVVIILAVVGLLAIRTLVPIFAFIVLALASGMFLLARKAGLITITSTQIPIDRLQI